MVKVTKLPPGKAYGADDLSKWHGQKGWTFTKLKPKQKAQREAWQRINQKVMGDRAERWLRRKDRPSG